MRLASNFVIHPFSVRGGVDPVWVARIKTSTPMCIAQFHQHTHLLQAYLKEQYGTLIIIPQ